MALFCSVERRIFVSVPDSRTRKLEIHVDEYGVNQE